MAWMTRDWWFDSVKGQEILSFPKCPDYLLGPLGLLFNVYHNLFLRR
jgi:hypothetical protein